MKRFYLNSYTLAATAITLVFHHLYHAWFQNGTRARSNPPA